MQRSEEQRRIPVKSYGDPAINLSRAGSRDCGAKYLAPKPFDLAQDRFIWGFIFCIGFIFFYLVPANANDSLKLVGGSREAGSQIRAASELNEDSTWLGTVILEDNVVVPAGKVLTIEPGTEVLMKEAVSLVIYGQLIADGNEAEPIRFTRYEDGTTWKQIMFVEAANSRFVHCVIEYADSEGAHQDYYEPGPRKYHEAVVVLASHVDFEKCVFQKLPSESRNAEGDATAIISDDPDHPGEASANIKGCQFLSIGQGVHTRFSYILVEDCFFTGKRGDNDDVDLWGESDPPALIQNNLFLNPDHDDMINPTRCSAVIIGNVVAGSDDHGIVLRDRCFPVVMNNVIYNCNNAGIAVENSCEALLVNNTIVDCGRGLRLFDLGRWGPPYRLNPGGGTATVINCIIWDCPQPVTLADSSSTEIEDTGSHITIKYCDIDSGLDGISISGTHSTVTWGQGNIDVDPKFADPKSKDYHLKSQEGRWYSNSQSWIKDDITSPCIDAGDPNSPIGLEPFPNGGIINMGAYGGTAEASKSPSGVQAKYSGGTGEPNDPYLIYTVEHMNTIGLNQEDWDKHFKLVGDIDLKNLAGSVFHLIGSNSYPFKGVFDGNGHTISNLTYDSNGVDYIGLFKYVNDPNAEIKDLGLFDPNIDAGIGDYVGSLVGYLADGTITGCYVEGASIAGDWDVGVLVGHNAGTIANCSAKGDVSGNNGVGGLTGYNDDTIINCYSSGDVLGKIFIGGLVGWNGPEIIPYFGTFTITNCDANSAVTAKKSVDGLVGWNGYRSSVTSCYSTSAVSGSEHVGGLVGFNCSIYGTISNCYSIGNVLGNQNVGGLVGDNIEGGSIINCYATGRVTGTTNVGGLAGENRFSPSTINASFWDIETSGLNNMCGTEVPGGSGCDDANGKTTAEMQTASTFLEAGWDLVDETANSTEHIWWILEGQDYPRLYWELMTDAPSSGKG